MLLVCWRGEAEKDRESVLACVIKLATSEHNHLLHLWESAAKKHYQHWLRIVMLDGGRRKLEIAKKKGTNSFTY